jgi:hypothetical protein
LEKMPSEHFFRHYFNWMKIFTNESLDTSVVSCIVRLGTMSTQMLTTPKGHTCLIEATATSSAAQCRNSVAEDTRQPGFGRALVWRSMG